MRFFEAHFINRVYVTSPLDPGSGSVYGTGGVAAGLQHLPGAGAWPRREIADPDKLLLVARSKSEWQIYEHKHSFYYSKRIGWDRKLKTLWPAVVEGDFHILCESPNMFASILDGSNMFDWLERWWQTPFLITTSVYSCPSLSAADYGLVNGVYPPLRYELRGEGDKDKELKYLLKGRCYTIGNGLTLALAMHRVGALKQKTKEFAGHLLQFLGQRDYGHMYQDVSSTWMSLYYGHPTQQVADFPWYYACMGPRFADSRVVCMLLPGETESFPHIVRGNHVAITTYKTAMLPYLNTSVWSNLGNSFVGTPDIIGMLTAISCNRRAWKWWIGGGGQTILTNWLNGGHLGLILKSSFILYTRGSDNGNVCRRRLRVIWEQIISSHLLQTYHLLPQIVQTSPFAFMQTMHHMLISQGLHFNTSGMKLMATKHHPYYMHCLDSRITTRLLAIYRIFGLGARSRATFPDSNIVGALLLDWFKEHKGSLLV
jgi:hypothetical protein